MASVQQAANQLAGVTAGALTTGAYLYSQTPTGRRNAEIRQTEGELNRISKLARKEDERASKNDATLTPIDIMKNQAIALEYEGKMQGLKEKLYDLRPTREGYVGVMEGRKNLEHSANIFTEEARGYYEEQKESLDNLQSHPIFTQNKKAKKAYADAVKSFENELVNRRRHLAQIEHLGKKYTSIYPDYYDIEDIEEED